MRSAENRGRSANGLLIAILADAAYFSSSFCAHACCGRVNGSIAPSLIDSKRIRDDQIVIDADRIAKTLTRRARTERRIEAEQVRLGLFVTRAVVFADERSENFSSSGKLQVCRLASVVRGGTSRQTEVCRTCYHRRMCLAKTYLERIDEPLADFLVGFQSVDQDICVVEIIERIILGLLQLDHLAVAIQSRKTLLKQRSSETPRRSAHPTSQRLSFSSFFAALRLCGNQFFLEHGNKHIKSRALRQRCENLIRGRFGRVFFHFAAADVTDGLSGTGKEQPQIIVDLGLRRDGRARILVSRSFAG